MMDDSSSDTNNWFRSEELAEKYAKYRLHYDRSMYEDIIGFCKQQQGFKTELAVDVGCGSGQSTFPLATFFDKIYGVDISDEQLKWAKKENTHRNVEFQQGAAENLHFIETGSVDLVLVGTAIHWFDHDTFFAEVRRILKPKTGHIAVYLYTPGLIEDEIGSSMTKKFFAKYLKAEDLYKNRFASFALDQKGLKLPFEEVTEFKNVILKKRMSVRSYIEFLCTTSNFNCSIGSIWSREEALEKMEIFKDEMEELYKDWPRRADNEPVITVLFPIYLQVGRLIKLNQMSAAQ